MSAYDSDFITSAEAYAARHRGALVFQLLGWLMRCHGDELDWTIKKIYVSSIPEETYAIPESLWKTTLGLAAFPFHLLWRKQWLWSPGPLVDHNFEVVDADYFNRFFRRAYAELKGTKRVTPRALPFPAEYDITAPALASVWIVDVARFMLVLPVLLPALLLFWLRTGLEILKAYRNAVSIYMAFNAYFRRYPCRNFVTFDDESNPPSRQIAFRQNGSGRMTVIQNGERIRHPHLAYGLMDSYQVFGSAYERILGEIKVKAGRFQPVGAPCLNERFELVQQARAQNKGVLYDVLFIDQGIHPYNGLDQRSDRGLWKILELLARFKKENPEFRAAYQLRYYSPAAAAAKSAVLGALKALFGEGLLLLENEGRGESYINSLRSELVITFESTLGFEAMMLGRKAFFVNFSGDPAETLCADPRFQLEDASADYARFAARLKELLALELTEIPEVARERHLAFDGRVQERIAASLNEEASR